MSSENPRVEFRVFDTTKTINDDSEFFDSFTEDPEEGSKMYTMKIRLIKKLDFLVQKEHLLTATCQVSGRMEVQYSCSR